MVDIDTAEFMRKFAAIKLPQPAPGTRAARIAAFHRALDQLPGSPNRTIEQTEEAMRLSGLTDLDFKAMIDADERADRQADAVIKWHEEQRSAWRRELIAVLTRWDEYPPADRKAFIVFMRDLFQHLAAELPTSAY
jgi:hypothetical protein